jgi:hypothetical protein
MVVEVLEKVKAFCRRIGGKVREYGDPRYRVVSCILPVAKRLVFENDAGLVRLISETDMVEESFYIGDVSFGISVRSPKHSIFRRVAEDKDFLVYVIGDFDSFGVIVKDREVKMSAWGGV